MEFVIGSYIFSSKFECGNLAKVTQGMTSACQGCTFGGSISTNFSKLRNDPFVDHAFNIWTQPDCGGTQFENNNRTWFCFSIKGGIIGERVQLSVMNLNKQNKLYSQGMQPVVRCVGDYNQSSNWERIKEKCSYKTEDNSTVVSWMHTVPTDGKATFYAFTYPFTYSQLQALLKSYDEQHISSPRLYYHREVAIYSLDDSRVDLLTVTSHSKKLHCREDRLPYLFPDASQERPFKFDGKKVVFVSARVHPGETPSSFVLNGFMNFILSSDYRAVVLRELFVFKVIPMLNPDGVRRGHYRSDQRGVNLNRVYNNPSLEFHPTIYAARKIILYYHFGMKVNYLLDFEKHLESESLLPNKEKSFSLPKSSPAIIDEETCHSFNDAVLKSSISTNFLANKSESLLLDVEDPSASGWDCSSNISTDSACRMSFLSSNWDEMQESSSKLSCSNETGMTSMFSALSPLHDGRKLKTSDETLKNPVSLLDCNFVGALLSSPNVEKAPSHSSLQGEATEEVKFPSCLKNEGEVKNQETLAKNLSISSVLKSSNSELFMYMDFHGHASKRGIFMYGNWFKDPVLMVENLLYPKLLSLQCSNFDFGACNFSERNMYHKDRRDGMSKEGSGRVAIMRATGIVRSYTLECNYNTGRTVTRTSTLPAAPPKYTPSIFEDCGQKLGICLFDLIERPSDSNLESPPRDLSSLRKDLLLFLSNSSLSPKVSQRLPSREAQNTLTSSKGIHGVKHAKEYKYPGGDKSVKIAPSTSQYRETSVNVVGSNLSRPCEIFNEVQLGILPCIATRKSAVLSEVDSENQEPHILHRVKCGASRKSKVKRNKSLLDVNSEKSKKSRCKYSKKLSRRSLIFGKISNCSAKTDIHSNLNFPEDDNVNESVSFNSSLPEECESTKLVKIIEKGRKSKKLKFRTKKVKNISNTDSCLPLKSDHFNVTSPLVIDGDVLAPSLPMDTCCVSSSTPLSPRSPLASVFEAKTSQSSLTSVMKPKSSTFVSTSKAKSSFHSCTKRASKALKTANTGSSDLFPLSSKSATGQRFKILPKKYKKPCNITTDLSTSKSLSKPTTSQASMQWISHKPLSLGADIEGSNIVKPRVKKKRRKVKRKSV